MTSAVAAPADFLSRVATAPISWGVCEVPGWGHQLEPSRVLSEMRSLGFTATELGSAGWLPEQVEPLEAMLAEHQLGLLASFVPLVLHDAAQADAMLAAAAEAADLLEAMGATYFNTAPVTSVDWEPRRPLSDAEWQHLFAMVGHIDQICAERKLLHVIHEHVGCVVETAEEIERLLENTTVSFVLDTGHMAIGGCDPLEFARTHADRVGLVHLKDTRLDVAARLNAGELTLMEAVQAGLFPALGLGELPIGEIVSHLEATGFNGHYVIEQDCAITGELPALGEGPIRDVEISVAYLRDVANSDRSESLDASS